MNMIYYFFLFFYSVGSIAATLVIAANEYDLLLYFFYAVGLIAATPIVAAIDPLLAATNKGRR
jgi:hypothetical protein